MKIIEYGKANEEVLLLLHGGGLSAWNYRDAANQLKEKYHVIVPQLAGHADSDCPFTSIEDQAKEIIDYIDKNFKGTILAIGGLSLGGQVLIEMLAQRSDICKFAFIESALILPMKLTAALIAPVLGMSYGLIKQKWFAKLQFKSLKIQAKLFEDYYRDTCKIQKQDMIRFLKANASYRIKPSLSATTANVTIFVGSKERRNMRRSAELLHALIPNSKYQILNGYSHGELSLNHPNEYVELLINTLSTGDVG
ncbi:alpha/beta fold hydrolase [Dielma fastidiosa]|uniref:alpha/beta fold hydrolase n=1 Tax=Dielma fastidiosa TaxID=1034346 RepID=UPI0023F2DCB0|nr:alpha/beta hydrolase [Dielma fastidiosa]